MFSILQVVAIHVGVKLLVFFIKLVLVRTLSDKEFRYSKPTYL